MANVKMLNIEVDLSEWTSKSSGKVFAGRVVQGGFRYNPEKQAWDKSGYATLIDPVTGDRYSIKLDMNGIVFYPRAAKAGASVANTELQEVD